MYSFHQERFFKYGIYVKYIIPIYFLEFVDIERIVVQLGNVLGLWVWLWQYVDGSNTYQCKGYTFMLSSIEI